LAGSPRFRVPVRGSLRAVHPEVVRDEEVRQRPEQRRETEALVLVECEMLDLIKKHLDAEDG
jgi:hypothetical protein